MDQSDTKIMKELVAMAEGHLGESNGTDESLFHAVENIIKAVKLLVGRQKYAEQTKGK